MFGIALKSLRAKWRDYIVLFIGLLISAAIFYMLSAIALNQDFLNSNSSIKLIVPIFMVGEVLLGIMTFVYLNFANSFLLRLRQSEYGLMSMLGAKKSQIGALLMKETLSLGMIATVAGMVLGMGLTAVSGRFLMSLLGLKLVNWSVFSSKAIIVTLIVFMALFLVNGLYNRLRLRRQDTLTLLQANQQVKQPKERKLLDPVLGLIGLLILIASFVFMPHAMKNGLGGLIAALVMNVWGTYWLISRTLKFVTYRLRNSNFNNRGLRSFLNGQLLFRLPDYQRMLTVLAIMFGLALGAMSVGQGYYRSLPQQAESTQPVTAAYPADKVNTKGIQGINWQETYHYVVVDDQVYFNRQEFNAHKMPSIDFEGNQTKLIWLTGDELTRKPGGLYPLVMLGNQILNSEYGAQVALVDNQQQLMAKGTPQGITLFRVQDFLANEQALTQKARQLKQQTGVSLANQVGVIPAYTMMKSVFGGLEFMGIFLGIAFLAMLASTLMFKVLSGVAADKSRYDILRMIGTSPRQMTTTIMKDLGILFGIPMVIGIADVVYGLQMFKPIMPDPYMGFVPSLIGITILYIIYYLMTVTLYRRLIK